MPYLLAVNGPESGKRFELNEGEYILGRHPDCHIVIDVGAVSRHHCKVFTQGPDILIEDLQSRNGTYLNDEVIDHAHELQHGDQVRICDVVFTFHSESDGTRETTRLDDSSSRAILVDDEEEKSGSTIMSKLDVTSSRSGTQIVASAEAKLNALMQITHSLGRALGLDEVLPQVLDSLFRIFVQADRGFIGLVNESGVLVPRWTKLRRENSQDTIRVSRTIANQVLESREAVLSSDASSDKRFDMSQSIADFRIRSMMCAPLLSSEGDALGILQIDTLDQRQRFQEEDLELLVSAAAQAAVAIENARLHEEALTRKSLERDLKLAHDVQHAFLPKELPDIAGYEFFDYYRAANQVGGDYYDYLFFADKRIAVVVADVVGHGVAAAMLMAKLSAEVRIALFSENQPEAAVTLLNSRLCELEIDRFVTLILVVIDPQSHETVVVNAGHLAPLLRRTSGEVEDLGMGAAGVPLGIVEGMTYRQVAVQLSPGESLTLLTDGLHESMNQQYSQYGLARVRARLRSCEGSSEEIGDALLADVRRHMDGRAQDDDMCLVVLRRMP